jgi:sterol desaturase/sphingolipid hydroxylase (fatty acid hydroxylase superfamily)
MNWKLLVILGSLFIFGSLENLFPFFQFKQPFLRRVTINLALGLLNTGLTSLTVIVALSWIWQQTAWQGYLLAIPWLWLRFTLSFLLLDVYMYAWHRLMHNSAWGWRLHQVHHSDRAMNTSTAYRFHAIEVLLSNLPKLFLIWLFGIMPTHLLIYEVIFAAELIFHHSNWALPLPLDRALSCVIVTPNYHRAHHTRLLSGMRSNYASLLTIWDLLFRSIRYPADPEAIKLGIPGVNQEFTLLRLLVLPF